MKKFILKISLFTFLFLVVITFITLLVRSYSHLEFDRNKTIVVLGHSHPEVAYNDALIEGLVNFSSSGESYFYNYFKLKILIQQNPGIKTVLIEFTNNQIGKYNDTWIWGDEKMLHFFPKYALFMDTEALKLLYNKNPASFKNSLNLIIRNNFKVIYNGLDVSDLGGFKPLYQSHTDSLIKNLKTNQQNLVQEDLSYDNLEYLEKIVALCNTKKIKIYFIRSPLHKNYAGYVNEEHFKKVLKKDFSKIEFLDFSKFPLEDSSYGDLEHLNENGARVFSSWFGNLIKNGLFNRAHKGEIILAEIQSLSNIKENE